MITRLRVNGFKNLVGLEARFGPLTGIAGLNGVGKSNLFDALALLKGLSTHSLVEAFHLVRGADQELRNVFTTRGPDRISFDLDMLVPQRGTDEFGQTAEASSTFLNYQVELSLQNGTRIELESETLEQIPKKEAAGRLSFASREWLESVVKTSRRNAPYISTDDSGQVLHHREGRHGGGSWRFQGKTLTRTVLSSAQNAQESPTAVMARKTLASIRFLQLEPTSLRLADKFSADNELAADGRHLPATLDFLSQANPDLYFTSLSNRLATLVAGVDRISVMRDEGRRNLIAQLKFLSGEEFPASSLSDGTLRFLALAALESDPRVLGTLCLEEPENGIHPQKLDAMLRLLRTHACDPTYSCDTDNPLRQVIFSTHSTGLVERLYPEELLFATAAGQSLSLLPVQSTWRNGGSVNLGEVISYLNGVPEELEIDSGELFPTVRQMTETIQGELFKTPGNG